MKKQVITVGLVIILALCTSITIADDTSILKVESNNLHDHYYEYFSIGIGLVEKLGQPTQSETLSEDSMYMWWDLEHQEVELMLDVVDGERVITIDRKDK